MDTNSIVNNLYHAAVISMLSVGFTMIGKKLLKIKPADLDKLSVEDVAKLTATISGSMYVKTWLVSQNILPPNILNST